MMASNLRIVSKIGHTYIIGHLGQTLFVLPSGILVFWRFDIFFWFYVFFENKLRSFSRFRTLGGTRHVSDVAEDNLLPFNLKNMKMSESSGD